MNNYRNNYSNTPYSQPQTPAYTPANAGWSNRSAGQAMPGRTAGADENPFDPDDRFAEADDSLDWNAVIHDDSTPYVLLEEGDYPFTVTAVEPGRYPGNEKSRPCDKAMVTVTVDTPMGPAYARRDLYLRGQSQGQLAAFFRCLGMMKRGENFRLDWDGAIDRTGRGHFRPEQYTNSYGETRSKNTVTAFYAPDDKAHGKAGDRV